MKDSFASCACQWSVSSPPLKADTWLRMQHPSVEGYVQREAPFLVPLAANLTLAAALVKASGMPQVSQLILGLCEQSQLCCRLEAHHKQ